MTSFFTRPSLPDQQQFHEAVRRGGNAWYGACLAITRDAALAQDAVQDALLNAWKKRRQFNGQARLDTWIHRIAVNSAIATVRRQRRHAFEPLQDMARDVALSNADSGPDSAQQSLAHSELGRDLGAALQELSEMERLCFVLKHLEEWRLAEIADRLEVSTGSVKQALFRAVKKLRVRMASMRET